MANNNTGIIIGVSAVAVVGIIITIVVVKSKPAATTLPYGYNPMQPYNPAMYPPGYVPQQNGDKAALYTAGASVLTKAMETFFGSKSSSSSTSSYPSQSNAMETDTAGNSFMEYYDHG